MPRMNAQERAGTRRAVVTISRMNVNAGEWPWQANVSVFFDFTFYLWVTFEKKWVIKSP